jgi:hypothetical protein
MMMRKEHRQFVKRELSLQGEDNPTEEEITAFFDKYIKEKDREKHNKEVYAKYANDIKEGYLHTDGTLYYCNERSLNAMVAIITIFDSNTDETTPIIDINGDIHLMSMEQLKVLVKDVGRYVYLLKRKLWDDLR